MSRMLAEQPLLLSIALGFFALAMIYGWLQSGKKPLLLTGLLSLLLIPAAWFIAEKWVTNRERIEQIIYETADAIEANDPERAVAIIADPEVKRRALAELPQWEFHQADVGSIQRIVIFEDTSPEQADVELIAKVQLSSRRGAIKNVKAPRRLFLTFEKRGAPGQERWLVVDYHHQSLVGKADNFSMPTQ